jgi:hypothetical protein
VQLVKLGAHLRVKYLSVEDAAAEDDARRLLREGEAPAEVGVVVGSNVPNFIVVGQVAESSGGDALPSRESERAG